MSNLDRLQLCEHVISSQLGSFVLEPVGRMLLRCGAKSYNELLRMLEEQHPTTKEPQNLLRNVLTILIKHNLLSTSFSSFDTHTVYSFSHSECLLRLSMPRYLHATQGALRQAVLREVFMAGSLTKEEAVMSVGRRVKGVSSQEVNNEINDLTLHHYLVGVSAHSLPSASEENKTRKRDLKK